MDWANISESGYASFSLSINNFRFRLKNWFPSPLDSPTCIEWEGKIRVHQRIWGHSLCRLCSKQSPFTQGHSSTRIIPPQLHSTLFQTIIPTLGRGNLYIHVCMNITMLMSSILHKIMIQHTYGWVLYVSNLMHTKCLLYFLCVSNVVYLGKYAPIVMDGFYMWHTYGCLLLYVPNLNAQ